MSNCKVEGCPKLIKYAGFCEMHYRRFKRHGDPTVGRPQHWGLKEKHPLNHSFMWFKRHHQLCEEWSDFWNFVAAVGVRKEGYVLQRLDTTLPLGPNNYQWKPTIKSTSKADYAQKWRKSQPEKVRNSYYKKRFGITLEQYNDILKRQGGVCAICNEKDSIYDNLAVDHDHNTNKVRGLLCHLCNRALGMFKDDSNRLEKALDYLKLS